MLWWFKSCLEIIVTQCSSFEAEEYVPLRTCVVCLQMVREYELNSFPGCTHQFCTKCIQGYCQTQISNEKIIHCLQEDCTNVVMSQSQLLLLEQQSKLKYKQILDSTFQHCFELSCQGYLSLSNHNNKSLICKRCKKTWCSICKCPAHQNGQQCLGTSKGSESKIFKALFGYQKCRGCNYFTEKISGCNHIICRCGNQFCYKCGGKWEEYHNCQQSIDSDFFDSDIYL